VIAVLLVLGTLTLQETLLPHVFEKSFGLDLGVVKFYNHDVVQAVIGIFK